MHAQTDDLSQRIQIRGKMILEKTSISSNQLSTSSKKCPSPTLLLHTHALKEKNHQLYQKRPNTTSTNKLVLKFTKSHHNTIRDLLLHTHALKKKKKKKIHQFYQKRLHHQYQQVGAEIHQVTSRWHITLQ